MLEYQNAFLDYLCKNHRLKGKRILEIGGHNGEIKEELIKRENCEIHSIDISPQSDNVIKMNAEELLYESNYFDFIFSLATFEHISSPEKAFQEAYRVLKPNCEMYIRFSPIWTAINGHHYNIVSNQKPVIPAWAHLYWDESEMKEYLMRQNYDKREEACDFIYHSSYINRLTYSEYMDIIKHLPYEHKVLIIMNQKIENEFNKLPLKYRKKLNEQVLVNGLIVKGRKNGK